MAKKAPAPSALTGSWLVISLTSEADEGLNEVGQALIEFDEEGAGSFHFGSIQGVMDRCRTKPRQGKRVAQFSWSGEDETNGDLLEGIGWVILDGENLTGTISVDMGDDHEFVAERGGRGKPAKNK